jgi:hypothetical protein
MYFEQDPYSNQAVMLQAYLSMYVVEIAVLEQQNHSEGRMSPAELKEFVVSTYYSQAAN